MRSLIVATLYMCIEPDNALCKNFVAQNELNLQNNFQNLQKELKRTKEFCDKGVGITKVQ